MADAPHAAVEGAGGHGAEASGAFPPFDLSLFSSQLFWFALTFGALYFVLAKVALPKVGSVLAKRAGTIQGDLDAAAQKSADADAARTGMEQATAKARNDARTMIEAQRAAVTAELAEEQAKAEAALNDRTGVAEARIAKARASALAEVDTLAADLAADIVRRILPRASTTAPTSAPKRRVQGEAI